ncbi:hypothetical protein [Aurantiacibacter hainanensis]|uniref:hypothetical protein n=1 Tax=Aurantiacibacter hainanensis TaxID=3076114 RepID=UPI0030C6BEF7
MPDEDEKPHTADRDAVVELLDSDGDIRLATLIGFGYIERYLGELIRAHLRDLPEEARAYLLKRPVKHLSDRIEFAVKLGSLDDAVANNLSIFAQIRHRFAHHIQARDCTDPEILAYIEKLNLVHEALEEMGRTDVEPENRLRLLILVTILKLHDLIESPFQEQ